MRSAPILAILSVACTRGQILGVDAAAVDASVAAADSGGPDGRQVRSDVVPDAGPVDAPPSGCSPDAGCSGAATCWQSPAGDYQCVSLQAAPTNPGGSCTDAGDPFGGPEIGTCCTRDEECTEKPRGRCVYDVNCGGVYRPPRRHCDYSGWCTGDRDCNGGTCTPTSYSGLAVPACLAGACRTSADCRRGPGGVCTVGGSGGFCGGGRVAYFCQYLNDICRVGNRGNDCPPTPAARYGQECVPNDDGHGTHCVPSTPPPP
jgi:hypothetical protein